MKNFGLLLSLFFLTAGASAQESGQIESISLFKNSLAVVRMTDSIPKDGRLQIKNLPEPVHGTFWIQSENPVIAKTELQLVDTPLAAVSQVELLRNLVGKTVTLHLSEDLVTGEILGETPRQQKEWDRNCAIRQH